MDGWVGGGSVGKWVGGWVGRWVGGWMCMYISRLSRVYLARLELGGRVAVGRARIKAALDVTYRYEVVHSRL